jgi:hypothetical protein
MCEVEGSGMWEGVLRFEMWEEVQLKSSLSDSEEESLEERKT